MTNALLIIIILLLFIIIQNTQNIEALYKIYKNKFIFHGGCIGCQVNERETCKGCCYYPPYNPDLPDLNLSNEDDES
jgi:hypothetical protein